MPRFTILRHSVGPKFQRPINPIAPGVAAGHEHWDWLFEQPTDANELASDDGASTAKGLWTWTTDPLLAVTELTVTELTATDASIKRLPTILVPALRLPNHRERYLHFEGEISGDRGRVDQIATGRYELIRYSRGSFGAMLTITNTRWLVPTEMVLVQFTHSSDESNPAPSAWTLRTGNDTSEGVSSTSDATL